jgi:hypothetical protein
MTIRIHVHTLLGCAALAGLVRAQSAPVAGAQAQGQKPIEATRDAKADVASLNELLSADVLLADAASASANTAPEAKHAPRQIGRVKDLVLATRNGDVAWAVISVSGSLTGGSKTIVIPASSLKCTTYERKPCYELRESEAALKGLPEFDVDRARKQGLDRALPAAEASKPAAPESDAKSPTGDAQHPNATPDKGAPASAPAFPPRFLFASDVKACNLNAIDKEFGKVRDAAVDARANRVAYVLIQHPNLHGGGESAFLMPLSACGWARVDNKLVLTSGKTVQQLSLAPEYQKPERSFVTPDQLRRADEFFGRPGLASGE